MQADVMRDKFQFFQVLQCPDVENFLKFCERVRVPAGETLWKEGDCDNYAAFILDGKLGIKKKTEFGGKHVIVGVYAPGSVVGELCLLTDNPRSVSAEVIEPADLVILHSQKFEEMIMQFPLIGLSLLKHIFITTSKRLTKSYERIASIF